MKTKTENVLIVLKVLAYIAMIGYSIQCGSQLISFIVAFFNPASAKDIPGTFLYLYELIRQQGLLYFINIMTFVIALSAMHAYVWYQVIRLLSSLNLKNPFSKEVASLLEKIGIQLLAIWILSTISEQTTRFISKNTGVHIGELHALNEYLFIAGIVYIISQVFKRGIELQEENDLTV
jgi:hypothetical protein